MTSQDLIQKCRRVRTWLRRADYTRQWTTSKARRNWGHHSSRCQASTVWRMKTWNGCWIRRKTSWEATRNCWTMTWIQGRHLLLRICFIRAAITQPLRTRETDPRSLRFTIKLRILQQSVLRLKRRTIDLTRRRVWWSLRSIGTTQVSLRLSRRTRMHPSSRIPRSRKLRATTVSALITRWSSIVITTKARIATRGWIQGKDCWIVANKKETSNHANRVALLILATWLLLRWDISTMFNKVSTSSQIKIDFDILIDVPRSKKWGILCINYHSFNC